MREPIDVIIPTLCDSKRGPLLLRAIDSVVSQEGVAAVPVVVVNGARFDPAYVERLKARTDIRLIQIAEPSLFRARRVGFETVRTSYFAILDDDDVFLPGALAKRLSSLRADPSKDWLVTNGVYVKPEGDTPFIPDIEAARRDPYATLLDHCWLCSAGNLFRTAAIDADIFEATRSMDLTYIAFRLLAEGKQVLFLDDSTFRYFYYPDSTSKQDIYTLPAAEAIQVMMGLPVPRWVRSGLARKYRHAMHDIATYYLRHGRKSDAWQSHLRSMAGVPEFFRYVSFTWRLLAGPSRGRSEPPPSALTGMGRGTSRG